MMIDDLENRSYYLEMRTYQKFKNKFEIDK